MEHALRERGGIKEVRRQSGGHPQNFGMRVEFNLPDGRSCHYAFEFSSGKAQKIKVKKEQCIISGKTDSRYFIENGSITETGKNKKQCRRWRMTGFICRRLPLLRTFVRLMMLYAGCAFTISIRMLCENRNGRTLIYCSKKTG